MAAPAPRDGHTGTPVGNAVQLAVMAFAAGECTILFSLVAFVVVVNPSFMSWSSPPGDPVSHYYLLFVPLAVIIASMVILAFTRARGGYLGLSLFVALHFSIAVLSYVQVVTILSKPDFQPSPVVFGTYLAIFTLILFSMFPGFDRREVATIAERATIIVTLLTVLSLTWAMLSPVTIFACTSASHGTFALALHLARGKEAGKEARKTWIETRKPRPCPFPVPVGSTLQGLLVLLDGLVIGCGLLLAFDRADAALGLTGNPEANYPVLPRLFFHELTLLGIGLAAAIEIFLPRVVRRTTSFTTLAENIGALAFLTASFTISPALALAAMGLLLCRSIGFLVSMKGVVRPLVAFLFVVVLVGGYAYLIVLASQDVPAGILVTIRQVLAMIVVIAVLASIPITFLWRRLTRG